jgi:hypothetical protein
MRQALIGRYPKSVAWKAKVTRMSDAQINAIYLRLKGKDS